MAWAGIMGRVSCTIQKHMSIDNDKTAHMKKKTKDLIFFTKKKNYIYKKDEKREAYTVENTYMCCPKR